MRWILLIFISLIFVQCTFQKRIYRKGFYVDGITTQLFHLKKESRFSPTKINDDKKYSASVDNKYYDVKSKQTINGDTCKDKLVLEDGREELVRVLVITEDSVKYVWCSGSKNIIRSVNKNYVKKIIYENGIVEEFEATFNYMPEVKHQETKKLQPDNGYLGRHIIFNIIMLILIILGSIFYWIPPLVFFGFFSALYQPYHARKIIRESNDYENAEGKKIAGKVLFYIGFIFWLLSLLGSIISYFTLLTYPYFKGIELYKTIMLISIGLSLLYLIILNATAKPSDW